MRSFAREGAEAPTGNAPHVADDASWSVFYAAGEMTREIIGAAQREGPEERRPEGVGDTL